MAAANPAQTLQDEATCPICLEYFDNPVSLDCDHNFCGACITQYWEGSQTVCCPQCRKTFSRRKLKPNRQLRNIVEAVRGLRLQSEREAATEGMCQKHREPLKLFCKDDHIPICVVCNISKEHRDHTMIPAEEAAEDFKKKIQANLESLRKKRKELLECKVNREERSQENLRKTQTETQKIVYEFQQLRQFLEKQEQLLLAQLEQLEQEMVKVQTENTTELSAEISRLSELIREMEGKCQKPPNEFLQDVKSTLSRCEKEKFQKPKEISPELENELRDFSQTTIALVETLMTFKDTLPSVLERKGWRFHGSQATVTLDPDTAHRSLFLSEDGKSMRCGDTWQDLPNNPERFDTQPCVLGREGFTSGRHYWEVEVGDGRYWAAGVARESVRRKGCFQPSPEEGIWAVRVLREPVRMESVLQAYSSFFTRTQWRDELQALTSPVTLLPQIQVPSRIRVCLDCDQGQVAFFDAENKTLIFTFSLGSVPQERLRPWFLVVWVSRFCLCP